MVSDREIFTDALSWATDLRLPRAAITADAFRPLNSDEEAAAVTLGAALPGPVIVAYSCYHGTTRCVVQGIPRGSNPYLLVGEARRFWKDRHNSKRGEMTAFIRAITGDATRGAANRSLPSRRERRPGPRGRSGETACVPF